MQRSNIIWIAAAILVLFVLMELICQPYGNFPLNDDWEYARAAKTLIDEHRLIVTPWTLAASVTPEVIGGIVCSIFGFSFELLRGVSIVMCFISMAALGYLLKGMRISSPFIVFSCLATLLVNPLVFNLSNSFMTDMSGFCMLLGASCFFYRYFRSSSKADLIACVVFSCALCLTRQVLISAPIAFFLASTIRINSPEQDEESKNQSKSSALMPPSFPGSAGVPPASASMKSFHYAKCLCLTALPTLAGVLCIWLHYMWLLHIGGPPFCYKVETEYLRQQFSAGILPILLRGLLSLVVAYIYVGLFLLPVVAACAPSFLSSRQSQEKTFLLLLSTELVVLLSVGFLIKHIQMPLADNVIYDFGLGPMLLPGPKAQIAPQPFWMLVTILSSAGAACLVSYLVAAAKRLRTLVTARTPLAPHDRFVLFSWCFLVIYIIVICSRGYFDRYLIVTLPFLITIIADISRASSIAEAPTRASRLAAATVSISFVLMLAAFSTVAEHDYFSWNRARWQAFDYLTNKQSVRSEEIDGGLEINGWLSSDPKTGGVVPVNAELKRGDTYKISSGNMANHKTIAQFPYSRWLFGDRKNIFALKKDTN